MVCIAFLQTWGLWSTVNIILPLHLNTIFREAVLQVGVMGCGKASWCWPWHGAGTGWFPNVSLWISPAGSQKWCLRLQSPLALPNEEAGFQRMKVQLGSRFGEVLSPEDLFCNRSWAICPHVVVAFWLQGNCFNHLKLYMTAGSLAPKGSHHIGNSR